MSPSAGISVPRTLEKVSKRCRAAVAAPALDGVLFMASPSCKSSRAAPWSKGVAPIASRVAHVVAMLLQSSPAVGVRHASRAHTRYAQNHKLLPQEPRLWGVLARGNLCRPLSRLSGVHRLRAGDSSKTCLSICRMMVAVQASVPGKLREGA